MNDEPHAPTRRRYPSQVFTLPDGYADHLTRIAVVYTGGAATVVIARPDKPPMMLIAGAWSVLEPTPPQ